MSESISSTVPAPAAEEPQDWYFTFGYDHIHPTTGERLRKRYVRIYGTCDSTRDAMFAAFGNRWAFQYASASKADRLDAYDMVEVAMPGGGVRVNALYRVVGVGPDGEREEGIARPLVEAMRIFDAVLANRSEDFHPHADVRLFVEPVASTR